MRRSDGPTSVGESAPPRLVCFDLDGTLLAGTSVNLHLAASLGRLAYVEPLEAAYLRGDLTVAELADATARIYRGLSRRIVWRTLAVIPAIDGLEEVLGLLRRHRVRVLLATCSWRFAAEFFQVRYGFDAVCGTVMDERRGRLSGVVSTCVDGPAKARFVADYCARHRILSGDCVAIGNSGSDVPMFAAVGRSVALNGTRQARAAASVSVDTLDLADLLPWLVRTRTAAALPVAAA